MNQGPLTKPLLPRSISQDGFRIRLEGYWRTNQEELWHLIVSDRTNEKRRGIWPGISSLDLLGDYMASCDFTSPHSSEYGYLIRLIGHGPIGTFHIQSVDWQKRCCEVGYWIHHASNGKGYARESLSLAENALRGLGFTKVSIETTTWNIPSWTIAEKAGYTLVKRFHRGHQCPGCDDCQRLYEKELNQNQVV